MSFAAVLLAAGGGSRFRPLPAKTSGMDRGHKLLSSFNGRPLFLYSLEAALGAGADETAIVWGAVDIRGLLPKGVVALQNPRWQLGLATSLAMAVDWCRERGHDAVVVGLGDAPLIPASAWEAVASSPKPVAVATFSGRPHPPVRLACEVWGDLDRSGDVGARSLWAGAAAGVDWVACEGDATDVDTTTDLAKLHRAGRWNAQRS